MIFPYTGTAALRSVFRLCTVAGLAFLVGCASYSRKPLLEDEFKQVLERRSPSDSDVIQSVSDETYDPDDGLTLQEAELLTLYLNPRLRSARQRVQIDTASARFAGLWDDPEIGADALRILDDVDEPWIAGASISFSIPISGRLAVAKKLAEQEAYAAVIEAWTEEQQVLLELRQAWSEWAEAEESITESRRLSSDLGRLVTITNRREELGELIAAEAVAFRLAEARLSLELEGIEAQESVARLRVIELLGLIPTAEVTLVPEDSTPNEDAFSTEDIYERSPQVVLAAARYLAAEERLRLEVRKQYPDITLGPLYGNEEGMDRLGIGFSVPIPILNANRQGIAEANAARDASRSEWEQAVQESLSELAKTNAERMAVKSRISSIEEIIVPLANQQIREARQLAELGELNTLLTLEALQAERDASLDLIKARASLRTVSARLRYLIPDQQQPLAKEDQQ